MKIMTARKAMQDVAPTKIPNLPDAWDSAGIVELDGFDQLNKSDLVGIPFLITSFFFRANSSGTEFVEITALDRDGNSFEFNDSSTGVRRQLITFLNSQGEAVVHERVCEFRIAVMKGLRFSEYEVSVGGGQMKTVRTYYLTLPGRRA